jgi:tripartite-type tricarboxylate transporter receptor subunit TctC
MLAAWLALVMAFTAPAAAQTTPSGKPITMVVPFPPGPSLDLVARLTSAKLADALVQPVVVENRTGANGTLGAYGVHASDGRAPAEEPTLLSPRPGLACSGPPACRPQWWQGSTARSTRHLLQPM